MMTAEQKVKVDGLIAEFAKDADVVAFVKATEARIATTKGHYGDYMNFLTPYASQPSALYIISQALKVAGADAFGVDSALGIIKGGR